MSAVRIATIAVVAVAVAEVAAWLLRPRGETAEPVRVSEHSYFSEDQLERAREYRSGQRLLLAGSLAVQGGLLILLVAGRPRFARQALDRAADRPVRGGAAAGALLALSLGAVALPFGLAAHERAVDVGLSTQGLGDWSLDQSKAAGIAVVLGAGAGALAIGLARRLGRRWWLPAAGAVVAFEVVFVWLAPVALAPLFNRFEPLEQGRARSDVLELGERAGVEIGEVYRVDASRRSTALNAYVDGIGSTKRVVVYDNLLEDANRAQLRSVVAHELAHVDGRDVPRGMLWVALVAPLAMLLVARSSEVMARRFGAPPDAPAALPATALALSAVALLLGVVGNQLSRSVEERADTFALDLTGDPRSFISLQRHLAERNLSDPDPPALIHFLLGSHPSTIDRIGAAESWAASHPPKPTAASPTAPTIPDR